MGCAVFWEFYWSLFALFDSKARHLYNNFILCYRILLVGLPLLLLAGASVLVIRRFKKRAI